jgi:hypothetical protein
MKTDPLGSKSRMAELLSKLVRDTIDNEEILELSYYLDTELGSNKHTPDNQLVLILVNALLKAKISMLEYKRQSLCC